MGPVLCLAISTEGDKCYSGGLDGTIRIWTVPSSSIDPYDSYGKIFHSLIKYDLPFLKVFINCILQ